jgi:hypothetical protein
MSKLNGDKSRFQVRRKAGLLRRVRARQAHAALQAAAAAPPPAAGGEQSGGVRGRATTLRLVSGGSVTE